MFPYMKSQNWLYHYQFREGIRNSLGGLARRALYINETDTAYRLYVEHTELIKAAYDDFFPDLREMSVSALTSIDQA
jgi:acyl carrier protein phosphodiesterase